MESLWIDSSAAGPIGQLPPDHRFFGYQRAVNHGGSPTEQVIDQHRAQFGSDYRRAEGAPHPIESLREAGAGDRFSYAQAVAKSGTEVTP